MTEPASVQPVRGRGGFSVFYLAVIMSVVVGFASFAFDFGRVELAKQQLRGAADAAARAGAYYLGNSSTARTAAAGAANGNTCIGAAVQVDPNADVELGHWDPVARTFSALPASQTDLADAIRVTCRCKNLPLVFGGAIGKNTMTVQARSTATLHPGGYGLIGLNSISFSGNSTASYWSSTGTVAGNAGNIASNGSITSTGSSTVDGTIWSQPGATVTGVTATNAVRTLSAPLSYPNGNSAPYTTNFNYNWNIPSPYATGVPDFLVGKNTAITVPGGQYVFHNVNFGAGATVTFSSPTTIYYFGNFNMSGNAVTSASLPKNLTIVAINDPNTGNPPGTLTLSGTGALYANIYAPQSDITLGGTGSIYGSVLGKTVTASGTSKIYYDLSQTTPGLSPISLVK